MASKHWKIHVKGEPSLDEIHREVGAHGGLVMRVHREKGETHVYFSGEDGAKAGSGLRGGSAASEVHADEVTRF